MAVTDNENTESLNDIDQKNYYVIADPQTAYWGQCQADTNLVSEIGATPLLWCLISVGAADSADILSGQLQDGY